MVSFELPTTPASWKGLLGDVSRAMQAKVASLTLRPRLDAAVDQEGVEHARVMLEWARDFIGRPHPDLGRNGAICPFVPKVLKTDHFFMVFHPEVTGESSADLRPLLLGYAQSFSDKFAEDNHLASLTMVFPRVPKERGVVVETVHGELKSYLMHKGFMLSPFHQSSDKPGIRNAEFRPYRAPYPCITMRYMGLHDIIFLDHNAQGFAEYARRFGPEYDRGEVSDEFGYVTLFEAARRRFGA
jgi:hypothetical protein